MTTGDLAAASSQPLFVVIRTALKNLKQKCINRLSEAEQERFEKMACPCRSKLDIFDFPMADCSGPSNLDTSMCCQVLPRSLAKRIVLCARGVTTGEYRLRTV